MNAFYLLIKELIFVFIILGSIFAIGYFSLWAFAKITYKMHIKKLIKNK